MEGGFDDERETGAESGDAVSGAWCRSGSVLRRNAKAAALCAGAFGEKFPEPGAGDSDIPADNGIGNRQIIWQDNSGR